MSTFTVHENPHWDGLPGDGGEGWDVRRNGIGALSTYPTRELAQAHANGMAQQSNRQELCEGCLDAPATAVMFGATYCAACAAAACQHCGAADPLFCSKTEGE